VLQVTAAAAVAVVVVAPVVVAAAVLLSSLPSRWGGLPLPYHSGLMEAAP
jgi:hypothetical protein